MKKYQRKKEIAFRKENDGIVLFNTFSGEPYYIEGTAINVWNILENRCNIKQIKSILSEKYESSPNMEKDILDFINDSIKEGLINVF